MDKKNVKPSQTAFIIILLIFLGTDQLVGQPILIKNIIVMISDGWCYNHIKLLLITGTGLHKDMNPGRYNTQ